MINNQLIAQNAYMRMSGSCPPDNALSAPGADLFERAAIPAAWFDRELRLMACTSAMRKLFAERDLFTAFPPDWRAACCEALGGAEFEAPRTTIANPGSACFSVRATFTPTAGGVSVVCVDETALASSERDLQLAHDTLRIAMSSANCGIWRLSFETRSVWVSPEYERIMGTKLTFDDLASRKPAWIFGEDLQRYEQFLRELTGPAQCAAIEHRLSHAPQTWIQVTCEQLIDPVSGAKTFIGMARNITARKQSELELMDATRRANDALGAKRSMLRTLLLDLGLSETSNNESSAADLEAHATGVPALTTRFLGLIKELESRDAVLGEAVEALRVSRLAAHRASAAKSHFLTSMTHELRTPLNAIIGYSELMLEDALDRADEGAVADQKRVLSAASTLLAMVDNILDVTKLEAGDFAIARAPFEPAAIVHDAIAAMQSTADQSGNALVSAVGDLGVAIGDAHRLRQCLAHLLSNACKFTRGGKISVTCRRAKSADGDMLVFDIEDTGIGICEEDLNRLFEPFALCDATRTRVQSGAGVGLTVTRGLAQLMGGDVSVRTTPGAGSVFTLTIAANAPLRQTQAA